MKYLYFLIPAFLIANLAQAKSTVQGFSTSSPAPGTGGMFPPHYGSAGGKDPKGAFRLIAKTYTTFKAGRFVPVDSVTYAFSNGRNGYTLKDDPNNDETVLFDESYTYFFNNTKNDYDKKLKRTQTYNSDNTVKSVTYTSYKDQTGWKDSARYLYTYENDKMIESALEIWTGLMWSAHYQSELQYANGYISSLQSTTYKAGFSYDGTKLMSVVDEAWSQASGWQPNQKKLYTYAGENVASYISQAWNASMNNWMNTGRWEYTYSGTNVASSTEFKWNGTDWTKDNMHVYVYDAGNNKLSDTKKAWDVSSNTFVNESLETATYNIYNQPLVITTQSWSGNTWTYNENNTQLRFYYDFPTSVPDVYSKVEVSTYPVPASDIINIDLDLALAQKFSVAIYDMQGRVLKSWQEAPAQVYRKQIPVSDMMPGNYFIKITGDYAQVTERFVIAR